MTALLDAPTINHPGLPVPLLDTSTDEGRAILKRVLGNAARTAEEAQFRALERRSGLPLIGGGAEIFPDEGLDHILNKVPRATTAIQTTYYLGLFSGSTASTVPARTDTLATNPASVTEPSTGAYARVAVANTDWAAIATNGSGRRTTSAQKSFPENTGSWGNINGFFLAAASTVGVAIFYANFDDVTAVPATVAGYTIRVTPYFHIDQ